MAEEILNFNKIQATMKIEMNQEENLHIICIS